MNSLLLAFWPAFANPAMLWWGAAASAPLIIHLLSKRKFREMEWAAMRYLLAAVKRSSRRIRLEQWLLLALRTLILLLLISAVAQIYLDQIGGTVLIQGQRTHKVIVIDGSYSMAYKPGDKSLFDRAREVAQEIVDYSSKGDGFTLLLMSDPPRTIVHTPAFERSEMGDEITNLQMPHGGADLPATMEKIEQILQAARRDVPKLSLEEVYFITDLGRSSWMPSVTGDEALAEFRKRSRELGNQASLYVIDLGQDGAENLAVTNVRTREPFATVGQDVEIQAQVRNFGRQNRTRQQLELLVDGRPAAEQQVDVEAGGERTVLFSHPFAAGGNHNVEIRLAPDLLDIDNHRYLAVPVREFINVLCVNGKPTGDPFTGATGYLAAALRPSDNVTGRAIVRVDEVNESVLPEVADLTRYDCIFLCNVKQFIGSESRRFDSYLKHGGGLVVFLGDEVQAESYNRYLTGEDPQGARIIPARLGEVVTAANLNAPFQVDPLDYQHRVLKVFEGNPEAGLLNTTVDKYFKLELPKDSKAAVVLGVQGNGPLIVEETIHRGRSVLVGTSADKSWTSMPLLPSYVPIVQELLNFAISGRAKDRNTLVGEAIGGSLRTAARGVPITVDRPDHTEETLELIAEGDDSVYSYSNTFISGMYSLDFGPPISSSEVFAVNVKTQESDLAHLTAAELAEEIWPDVTFSHWTSRQDPAERPAEEISRRSDLHQQLLYLVLGLLFLETLLAWRFAHHTPA